MQKVDQYQPIGPNDKTVAILRAFHTYLLDGRVNFLHDLQSLQTDQQQLYDYAQSLINGLVTPLRSLRSTPGISPRLGIEDSIDNIASELAKLARPMSIDFSRENINDTKNAITMLSNPHRHFERFNFSFEATSQLHKYRIQIYRPRIYQLQHLPRTVTFNQYDQRYDLPSPELLKVHAIIARIFHTSSVAENVEKALRDLAEHCMLAKDGSTDISSMLAVTTLGVLGSRAGNVQQTRADT
ncbi:unnamed protein product [Penicillium viridicatum]